MSKVIELPLPPADEAEYAKAKYRRREKCLCGHEHWQHDQETKPHKCEVRACGCTRFIDGKRIHLVPKETHV